MLIIAGTKRWTRYGQNYWFDHKEGKDYKVDYEMWFSGHVLLIYQGVVLFCISESNFWDLVKDPCNDRGYT